MCFLKLWQEFKRLMIIFVHGHPTVSIRSLAIGLFSLLFLCVVSSSAQEGGTVSSIPVQHVRTSVAEMLQYAASTVPEKGIAPPRMLMVPRPDSEGESDVAEEQAATVASTKGMSPGLDASFISLGQSSTTVPDTNGAVGPSHLMVTFNDRVGFQDREGTMLDSMTLNSFWSALGVTDAFDPKVVYDPHVDRFIMVTCAQRRSSSSSMLLGVSLTDDPTGSWDLWQFDGDSGNQRWVDYPSLGFTANRITFTSNMFSIGGDLFQGVNVWVIDKSTALDGGAIGSTLFFATGLGGTIVPAATYDSGELVQYLVNRTGIGVIGSLRVYKVDGALGSPSAPTAIGVAQALGWSAFVPGAPRAGKPNLDASDDRLQNALVRNGSLWTTHSIGLPRLGSNHAAVQWWEINPTTGAAIQVGIIDDSGAGTHYFMPSITVNADDDVLLGFSGSSSSTNISAFYAFRAASDAATTVQSVELMKAGESPFSSSRWGDYNSTSVDPVDDITMWALQEYAGPGGKWGSWWGKIGAATGGGGGSPPDPCSPDLTVPTLTRNGGNITIECGGTFNDPGASATDDCDGDLTDSIVVGGDVVDTGTPAVYTVTYNVQDTAGNVAPQVSRNVQVRDTIAPTITRIGGPTMSVECGASFNDPGATASDSCEGNLTSSITVGGDFVDTDSVGSYLVTYNVSDSADNDATQVTRTVNVVDTTLPTIARTGPASLTLVRNATYSEQGATVSDSCAGSFPASVGGDEVNIAQLGTYVIEYTGQDPSGNSGSMVTRSLEIVLGNAPTIALSGGNLSVQCGGVFSEPGFSASDVEDGHLTGSVVVGGPTVNTGVLGNYIITYNVSDSSGNTAGQATRTITVEDTTGPTVTLSGGNMTVECTGTFTDPGATALDSCEGDVSGSLVVGGQTVNTGQPGIYIITYDAQDGSGNPASQVTRTVTVADTTKPLITRNIFNGTVNITLQCGDTYAEPGATVSDGCEGDISSSVIVGGDAVVTTTPGDYVVTYAVTDAGGNTANASRIVRVRDTVRPTISLVGPSVTSVVVNTSYVDEGATAEDNCAGDVTSSIVTVGDTIDTSAPSVFSVTYNVQDGSGNNAIQVTRTVNVEAGNPPTISLIGGDTTVECGGTFTPPTDSASDIEDGDLSGSIVVVGESVNTSVLGDHVITYDVTDSSGNNAVQVTHTVTVVDTTPPSISVIGGAAAVECDGTFNDLGATASDSCEGSLTGSIVVDTSELNTSTPGVYLVRYNVQDSSGNSATEVTRTVTVEDTTRPVLSIIGSNMTVECGGLFNDPGANASDSCAGNISGSVVASGVVDTSTVGVYMVTYDVQDPSGNDAISVTRNVTVQDTTSPTVTQNLFNGTLDFTLECGDSYAEPGATAFDLCGGDLSSSVVVGGDTVDTSTPSNYVVTYMATDGSGNSSNVSRTVTILDQVQPTITLNGPSVTSVVVNASYNEQGATADDDCEGDLSGSIVVGGDTVDTSTSGTYIVRYNVDDGSANSAVEVTRTVNVEAGNPPSISLVGGDLTVECGGTFSAPTASATDIEDGSITGSIVVGGDTIDTGATGVYVITYDVTDSSGNAATQVTHTVTVEDTTVPTISVIGGASLAECGTTYNDGGTTASDGCDGSLTGSIVVDTSGVDMSTPGVYQVTFNVSDSSGNPAVQATRTVTVQDTTPPVLSIIGSDEIIECGGVFTDLGASGLDSCAGDVSGSVIASGVVDTSTPAVYVVTYNVEDPSGNDAIFVTRNVTVLDTTPPVITLNGGATVTVIANGSFSEPDATASDICDGVLVVGPPSGIVNLSLEGTYTLTYTVSDGAGNAATPVVLTVEVVAGNPPVLLVTPGTDTVECGGSFTDAGATASDDEDGVIPPGNIVVGGDTVDESTPGTYVITYDVVDSASNPATQVTRIVTIVDTSDPTVTPVLVGGFTDFTIECGSTYVEAGATADDAACEGDISGSVVVGGDFVDTTTPGDYVVTYDVTDGSGNSATQASRTVTVADTVAPAITVTGGAAVVECGSSYSDLGATALDGCEGDLTGSIVVDISAVDTSTQGVYLVTYDVADGASNAAGQATRSVTVQDTTAPTITLNGLSPMTVVANDPYSEPGAMAMDDCEGDISGSVAVGGDTVDTSTPGVYTVTYDVTDSESNAATQVMRTVAVVQGNKPVITLSGGGSSNEVIVECGGTYSELGFSASDVEDGVVTGSVVVDSSNVDETTPGTYFVTYNVTDDSGNAADEVTRQVRVTDTTAPTLSLTGGNMTIACGDTFTDPGASALDVCEGDISGSVVVGGDVVSASSAPGVYTITYDVADGVGNAATQVTRTVTVTDTTPPTLLLTGGNETIECGVVFVDLGATAIDGCDGDIDSSIVVGGDVVDTTTPGVYVLTYNVSDGAGNSATQVTRTVTVQDTVVPTLSLLMGNLTLECGDTYTEFGATATDVCEGDLSGSIVIAGDTVDTSVLGSYVVTYNVSDGAGNAATEVTRTVTVQDTTAPTITLNGSATMNVIVSGTYTEPGALASDDCEGDLSVGIVIAGDTVNTSALGTFVITYNVSDTEGNVSDEVTRTVTVVQGSKPEITLLGGDSQNRARIECGDAYVDEGVTASDAEDGDLIGSVVIDSSGVDLSRPGTYTVRYNVTDSSGNTADEVTRLVRVRDSTAPTLTLTGGGMTISCGGVFTDPLATSSDSCTGDISDSIIVGGDTVDVNAPGTYTITYDVQDNAGNAAPQVSRIVTVEDTVAPAITVVGGDETIECGSVYVDAGATAADDCQGDLSNNIVSGGDTVDTETPGTYTITYNVVDASGNAANQATRTVTVSDTTAPTLILSGTSPVSLTINQAYTDAGATATDACEGGLTGSIVVGGLPIDTSTPNTFIITYDVQDSAGNDALQLTRTVNVVQGNEPTITVTGGDETVECGSTYTDKGTTADDIEDGNLTEDIVVGGDTVDTSTPGTYVITYDVPDSAGNNALQKLRTVTVEDSIIPVITLIEGSILFEQGSQTFVDPGATASDSCAGDITGAIIVGGDTVDENTPAIYTITYNVQDNEGNAAAQVTRTVTVLDSFGPRALTIEPITQSPAGAGAIEFSVEFSEEVSGFDDESDLVITENDAAHLGAQITGGPTSYIVALQGVSGNGTARIAANTASNVVDTNGNPLSSSVTSADITVDTVSPDALSITEGVKGILGLQQFTVLFSEPITNFDSESDLLFSGTTVTHTGISITGGPAQYTLEVLGLAGFGEFSLQIAEGSDIVDLAGNPLGSIAVGPRVQIVSTIPFATVGPPSETITFAGPVTFFVTYENVDASTITLEACDVELSAQAERPRVDQLSKRLAHAPDISIKLIASVTVTPGINPNERIVTVFDFGSSDNTCPDNPNLTELAQVLFDGMGSGDTDGNGTLNFAEAQGILPTLTADEFEQLDTERDGDFNRDEELTAAELARELSEDGFFTITIKSGTALGEDGTQVEGATGSEGDYVEVDRTNPSVLPALNMKSEQSAEISFSEVLDGSGLSPANYTISGDGVGTMAANPDSVTKVEGALHTYLLQWNSGEAANGGTLTVTVGNVTDLIGNPIGTENTASAEIAGIGTSPSVVAINVVARQTIDVIFSEAMGVGVLNPENYEIRGPGQGTFQTNPAIVSLSEPSAIPEDPIVIPNTYRLIWSVDEMVHGEDIRILVTNVEDVSGTVMGENNFADHVGGGLGISPTLLEISVLDGLNIAVTFDEVMGATATEGTNYFLTGSGQGTLGGSPDHVTVLSGEGVQLTWDTGEMFSGGDVTILADGVQDEAGNVIGAENSATHVGGAVGLDPGVDTVSVQDSQTIDVIFSEPMGDGVLTLENYALTGTGRGTLLPTPSGIEPLFQNLVGYRLTWSGGEMVEGAVVTVTVTNVEDVTGNPIGASNSATDLGGGSGVLPEVTSVSVNSGRSVDVTFSEEMGASATAAQNYTVSGTARGTLAANPDSVTDLGDNTFRLVWNAGEMLDGADLTITAAGVSDVLDNEVGDQNSGTDAGGGIAVAPTVSSISVLSGRDVALTFSEGMDATALLAENYVVSGSGLGTLSANPDSVELAGGSTYQLNWNGGDMAKGGDITVIVSNASDSAGNLVGAPNSATAVGEGAVAPTTVTLPALRDVTLYEDGGGTLANGAGAFLFAGQNEGGLTRRALVAFDIAGNVPATATILEATLTLNNSDGDDTSGSQPVDLLRAAQDWGEGVSNAGDPGSAGAPSATNDATWIHTFFDTATWDTPGGDLDGGVRATTSVGGVGAYQWDSTGIVADVQTWLDDGGINFGWFVRGNESGDVTVKRFNAAEHATEEQRPVLTVKYVFDDGSCAYSVPAESGEFDAGATSGSVDVTTVVGCTWTVSTTTPWITITSASSDTSSGTVSFDLAANTGPARSGTLTVEGQVHTVLQANGCTFSITPASRSVDAADGANTVDLTTVAGCAWTAVANDPWITITSNVAGSGNATVGYTLGANVGPARTGTVTLGGETHTITQASGCTFVITPADQTVAPEGGDAAFSVTALEACAWDPVSNVPWITIVSAGPGPGPGPGAGDGEVTLDVAFNAGAARTGSISVDGQTVTILQGESLDSDQDGLPDVWEFAFFGSLAQSASDDADGDGLTNVEELSITTDPTSGDSDGDGVSDAEEVAVGSDPVDGTAIPPWLDVDPDFRAVAVGGGTALFQMANEGGGELVWSVAVTSGNFVTLTTAASGTGDAAFTVTVDENISSVASLTGTIRITAVGAVDSPFDVTVTQPGCEMLGIPLNIMASEGTLPDQVVVTWDVVDLATSYEVFRRRVDQAEDAFVSLGTVSGASFSDTTAAGAVPPESMSCPSTEGAIPTLYFYTVNAINACGTSENGQPDIGHRGESDAAVKSASLYETVMPSTVIENDLYLAWEDSELAIRLRGEGDLDPDSVWGVVSGTDFESADVLWQPISFGTTFDGWVVYHPETLLPAGDLISMTVGAQRLSGEPIDPVTYWFQIETEDARTTRLENKRTILSQPLVSELDAEGNKTGNGDAVTLYRVESGENLSAITWPIGSAYAMFPVQVYRDSQRVWLPIPPNTNSSYLQIYYYYDQPEGGRWYPAEAIAGWLEPESHLEVEFDGITYLGFLARHAGTIQLGMPVSGEFAVPELASMLPGVAIRGGHLGDVMLIGVLLLLLLSLSLKVPNRPRAGRAVISGSCARYSSQEGEVGDDKI